MTIADFLYQAGFWQWVGILILAGFICDGASHGIANFHPLLREKSITKNKYTNTKAEK